MVHFSELKRLFKPTVFLYFFIRIDVIFAIELFEQFVLNVFAGEVITKPMPNAVVTNFEQVSYFQQEFVYLF